MVTIKPTADSIFLAAIELPPDQRADYLNEACANNAELLARVERLLAAHSQVQTFLETPASELGPTVDHAVTETAGSVIGSYKLLEQIGEGGFGVVFLAEQTAPIRRRVALKIVKPGMDTRQVIARFEAERQALALMDHPNVAKVFDAGTTDTGRPYFVMELVEGVPITDYCDECELTTRERLELFVTVCQAVQHAHQRGVIHRDIKPTNVLVAIRDGQPAPKIIDFGVAKAIEQRLTERTLTTAYAQLVGTPMYMSPEQAELSPLGVDTRTDIYSLGVLLYELLTGTTPFDKERVHAASYDEMRRIIREEEPPRPSARISTLAAGLATTVAEHRRTEMRRLVQQVRGELDWIVMKALDKDRNRRYETPNDLARDFERYLHDEPVQACPPSASYRFRKFARRHKSLLAAGGAIAAALFVGLGLFSWQYFRATSESARAREISGLLDEMLSSSDTGRAKGSQYTVRELLDEYSATIGSRLGSQPYVEADIQATIGRAYASLKLPYDAQPHFERAIELRRKLDGSEQETLAGILVDYGLNLYALVRFEEAESCLREALEIYRKQGSSGARLVGAMNTLVLVLAASQRFAEAEQLAQDALAIAIKGQQPSEIAAALARYAELKNSQGQFVEAERFARQALEMQRLLNAEHQPATAHTLRELAIALQGQNKLDEADTSLRESLAIFRRYYPENHFFVRAVFELLRTVLEARGEHAELDQLARVADEQARQPDGPEFRVRLAGLLLDAGASSDARTREARQLIRRAIEEYSETAAGSPGNLDHRLQLVQGYTDIAALCTGNPQFAEEHSHVTRRLREEYRDLLATFRDPIDTIDILYTTGLAQLRLGDQAGYRTTCKSLVQVPATGNVYREYRRVWLWCLGPEAGIEMNAALEKTSEVVALRSQNGDHRLALAGILYRHGEFRRAAKQLDDLVAAPLDDWYGEGMLAGAQLLMAMTQWQMGEKNEARETMTRIQPDVDQALASPATRWNYRSTVDILYREARSLIAEESPDETANHRPHAAQTINP